MFRIHLSEPQYQRFFLLQGSHQSLTDLMMSVENTSAEIGVSPPDKNEQLPIVFVPEPNGTLTFPQNPESPWLVWNRNNLSDVTTPAQEEGAICVLPQQLSIPSLLNALKTADAITGVSSPNASVSTANRRNYEKGEQVHLEEDRVVRVRRGIVRSSTFHADGHEVLIGFYGPGDVLIAHASYNCDAHNCHVEMRAHTPLSVTIEPWSVALTQPDFYDRLKQRICQMELWSSMQARATVEDRLMGILQVIGGRFSHDVDEGVMLDIKLTHEQLAGSIGATRTTVTRLLGSLRKKGLLKTTKTPVGEFFVINTRLTHCDH